MIVQHLRFIYKVCNLKFLVKDGCVSGTSKSSNSWEYTQEIHRRDKRHCVLLYRGVDHELCHKSAMNIILKL